MAAPLSRAERNAAIANAGSVATAATCPWGGDHSETGSQASSRGGAPSSRNTCPWGAEQAAAPTANRRSNSRSKADTCPWGDASNDADSKRLAEAARRRTKESPKHFGAAGSGAPKPPTGGLLQRPVMEQPVETTQRLSAEDRPIGGWAQPPPCAMPEEGMCMDMGQQQQRMGQQQQMGQQQMGQMGAEQPDGDEDEDQVEQRELIQHCLAEGLDEEQIMEMLEQWQNDKLLAKTREKMERMPPAPVAQPKFRPAPAHQKIVAEAAEQPQASLGVPFGQLGMAVGGTSVAASRMVKGKKSASFGPTDEEIVDVLQDYAKENLTPPESGGSTPTGQGMSLAAKRAKDKQTSEAATGGFNSDKASAAYFESRKQMDAIKNKNRQASRIF